MIDSATPPPFTLKAATALLRGTVRAISIASCIGSIRKPSSRK